LILLTFFNLAFLSRTALGYAGFPISEPLGITGARFHWRGSQ